MDQKTQEWLKQADYDMDTAKFMFDGGRYFYAVFMCHLSLEKALKGLYYEKRKQVPPKVHNLVYLLSETGIKPPEEPGKFLVKLNEASIITRYPDDLRKLQSDYTREVVQDILKRSAEVLQWIKRQF